MDHNEAPSRVVHPNGLTLALPDGLSARQLPQGFRVERGASAATRRPQQVIIAFHSGAAAPEGEWPQRAVISGRVCSLRTDRAEGGSGGDTAVLQAWCAYADGHVRLEQHSQWESPELPDRSLMRQVIAAISEPHP